jgi:uncharacterized protein
MDRYPTYDRPWNRAGAVRYAAARIRGIIRPPISISLPPPNLLIDRDVAVRMRDGVVLRVNVYRPPDGGQHPVILSAHPYGKDKLPKHKWGRWSLAFPASYVPTPPARCTLHWGADRPARLRVPAIPR